MKLLFAVTTTLFATSASAKMGEHRNLHAKVDALQSKIAEVDALKSEVAELKALLLGVSHAAPQGKKNLRRALEGDLVIDSNATTTEEDGTPEEKADALVAQFGFVGALKKLLVDMDPVYNCLGFDEVTNTCSFGGNEFVDIVAQEGINIDAGNSEDGGNIEIHAEQGNDDFVDGSVLIKGNTGSIEITSDDGIDIEADDDITLDAGTIDIVADSGVTVESDDITLDAGGIDIEADDDVTISGEHIVIDGDDSVDIIAGDDDDDASVVIKSSTNVDITAEEGDVTIEAGEDDDFVQNVGGNVLIEANRPGQTDDTVGAVIVDTDRAFIVDGTVVP